MKHFLTFLVVATALLVLAASACTPENATPTDRLILAEEAIEGGRFTSAQKTADALLADSAALSVADLCRLSVLFMKLSDLGAEQEANTAYAARALATAYSRNPDSTRTFIAESPVDVLAAMTLLSAINEAPHGIVIDGDTIFFTTDSNPDEEHEHEHEQ